MKRYPRKPVRIFILVGVMIVIGACSRSITPTDPPLATSIDLSLEQTLTAISLVDGTSEQENQPEITATATEPPLQASETPPPALTETPPAASPTSEITEEPTKSSTGQALIVTQTVTPAMIPAASGTDWGIGFLDVAPVIDGDFGDWPGAIYAIDQVVYGREFYANQIDLFGEFKLGWDADYLYLGVLVRDSRFVQTASEALLFQGDSIEVLLDTDRDGDLSSQDLSADDFQLGFSAGNLVDIPLPEAYLWAPTDQEGPMQSAQVSGRLTDDGYMMEVAIAWDALGMTPTSGMSLGFLLSISDNDSVGKNEQQSVISISETRNLTNPATWLTVRLVNP